MKKILSVIIVIAMLMQGISMSALASLSDREAEGPVSNIELLTVPAPVMEYTHGYYTTEIRYDEETGKMVELGRYFNYEIEPEYLTLYVTLASGNVRDMNAREIAEEFGFDLYIYSDQSFDTPWGVGENTYRIEIGDFVIEVPYVIEESNIQSVAIVGAPEPINEGEYGYIDCDLDEDGNPHEYYRYMISNPEYEITYKDGTSEVLGAGDFQGKFGTHPSISDDQSYLNPWGVGTHTVNVSVFGFDLSYEIEIIGIQIRNIELLSAPGPVILGTHGDYETEGYYDFEIGEWVESGRYFRYEIDEEDVILNVTLASGDVREMSLREIAGEFGIYWHVSSDQSFDTPWGIGEHYFYIANDKIGLVEVPFTIIESDIVSVTAVGAPFEVIEYTNGYYAEPVDEYGYPIPADPWFSYDVRPQAFRIKHESGLVETLTLWEISDAYGQYPTFSDDQSYYNQWGIGTHSVTAYVAGAECTYDVIIIENPIKNIVIDDVVLYQDYDGYLQYDPVAGGEFFYYYVYPDNIKVELNDGSVLEGNYYFVLNEFGLSFAVIDDQSYYNRWDVGYHKAVLRVGSTEYEFNVQVVPLPIKNVKFVKVPAKTSYTTNELIDTSDAVLRVEYVDGSYDDVALGGWFDTYLFTYLESSYTGKEFPVWNHGVMSGDGKTYTVTAEVAGFSASYSVSVVKQNAATNVTLSNENGYLYLTYTIDGRQTKEQILDIVLLPAGDEFGQMAVITLPSGRYSAQISFMYDEVGNLDLSSMGIYIFGAKSNTLEGIPWFFAFNRFDSLRYYAALFDLAITPVMTIDGKITPVNAYFASFYAVFLYMSGYVEEGVVDDITIDYVDDSLMISQNDLKKLIAAVYNIDGEIDLSSFELDSILSDGYYFFGNADSAIGSIGLGVFSTPYGCVAVKVGDSWAYDFSTTVTNENGSLDLTMRIMPDGTLGKIVVGREVISEELIVSDSFKTVYTEGQVLDLDGLTISVVYSGGAVVTIPVTSDMVSGYDPSKIGEQVVTITNGDFTATITVTVNKAPDYIRGDVNGDGKVNMKDVLMARKAAARVLTLTDEETERADVVKDGYVNLKDVLLLRKVCAGVEHLD